MVSEGIAALWKISKRANSFGAAVSKTLASDPFRSLPTVAAWKGKKPVKKLLQNSALASTRHEPDSSCHECSKYFVRVFFGDVELRRFNAQLSSPLEENLGLKSLHDRRATGASQSCGSGIAVVGQTQALQFLPFFSACTRTFSRRLHLRFRTHEKRIHRRSV